MPKRQREISTGWMCAVSLLSLLSILVFLFYLFATVGQFPGPRTADEAVVLFQNYPSGCTNGTAGKSTAYYRFSANWFFINWHYLLVLNFATLPALYVFSLFFRSGISAFLIYAIFSFLVTVGSIVSYGIIEGNCAAFSGSGCNAQCIYQAADWSAPKADGDITVTGQVSTAFTILRILVPIMWAMSILLGFVAFFAMVDVDKVFSSREGELIASDESENSESESRRTKYNLRRRNGPSPSRASLADDLTSGPPNPKTFN